MFYSDTLIPNGKESSKNRLAMVVLYFSVMIMAVMRLLLFLQFGIATGFGAVLIIKLVARFIFLLFAFPGFKDEIEIIRK